MGYTGYLHPLYSQSFFELGESVELPASKSRIIKRSIPGTGYFDGMGCYPIFACNNWSSLEKDLEVIGNQLISLSLVTDPFGQYSQQYLLHCFKDIARPYKEHFVIDLEQQPQTFVSQHHQRYARKALQNVKVDICETPIQFLDEWCSLYDNLIKRHNISGITKFSRASFARQLSVPGMIAFRAIADQTTVGMLLWAVHDKISYYHLGAYSPDGYNLKASFALFWTLLEYFRNISISWLSLGAGAGVQGSENDGLTRFKRGWATGTKTAYFCGRIFDHKKYQEIIEAKGIRPTKIFPAYRASEFR